MLDNTLQFYLYTCYIVSHKYIDMCNYVYKYMDMSMQRKSTYWGNTGIYSPLPPLMTKISTDEDMDK